MPLSITKTTPRKKRYLTKGGLQREDSDDELGYDDHPWQWIYEDEEDPESPDQPKTKKRKAGALDGKKRCIVGARMGSFAVGIGDSVLLKSPEQGKDWVGLASGFSDENEDGEEEMCVHILWFCAPDELYHGSRRKPASDVLPNESFITSDFNLNPLTAINGRATVLSQRGFPSKLSGWSSAKIEDGGQSLCKDHHVPAGCQTKNTSIHRGLCVG